MIRLRADLMNYSRFPLDPNGDPFLPDFAPHTFKAVSEVNSRENGLFTFSTLPLVCSRF